MYTATIPLTAKTGYTLTGVSAGFLTVAGATIVSNSFGSGVATTVFPATAAAATTESDIAGVTTEGDQGTITVGSQSVDMIYANNQVPIIFPFSPTEGWPADNSTATLTRKFFLSEAQVTNAHMVEVLQWGYDNGKFSTSAGDHNGLDTITAKQLTNIETGYNANPKVLSLVGPGKALDDTGTYLLGI